jgi:hypothetical protein
VSISLAARGGRAAAAAAPCAPPAHSLGDVMWLRDPSWSRLEAGIAGTFRKWRALTRGHAIEAALAATPDGRRKATLPGQTAAERRVTLRFTWFDWDRSAPRQIVLAMQREERAIDNLRLLARAIEWIRVADAWGVTSLVVKLYRQMYPPLDKTATATAPRPAIPPRDVASAYATLHLAADAPLEVAEAAYKVLVRTAHPDSGGSHADMVTLNAAIQRIRADRARR